MTRRPRRHRPGLYASRNHRWWLDTPTGQLTTCLLTTVVVLTVALTTAYLIARPS